MPMKNVIGSSTPTSHNHSSILPSPFMLLKISSFISMKRFTPWTPALLISAFPSFLELAEGAVKLHTLMNPRCNIPEFTNISDGKIHDVKVLDILIPEPDSFYVMDRGYFDYARLYKLHQAICLFR